MPVRVRKIGKQYCVVDSTGKMKKGRCHSSRKKAVAQVQAINLSMLRKKK